MQKRLYHDKRVNGIRSEDLTSAKLNAQEFYCLERWRSINREPTHSPRLQFRQQSQQKPKKKYLDALIVFEEAHDSRRQRFSECKIRDIWRWVFGFTDCF